MKKTIQIFLPITVVIALITSFTFRSASESFNQTLYFAVSIISSFTSILTLLIAIALYNKYGIDTPLLEKHSTVVFAFIEEFKKARIAIHGDKFGLFVAFAQTDHETYKDYSNVKLIFSTQFFDGMDKLFDISNSPFMPKSISQKVEGLKWVSISSLTEDELNAGKYAKVLFPGKPLEKEEFWGRVNEKDITVLELLNTIQAIKIEVIKWIRENSQYSQELNL